MFMTGTVIPQSPYYDADTDMSVGEYLFPYRNRAQRTSQRQFCERY
jgi:hypothetical protein